MNVPQSTIAAAIAAFNGKTSFCAKAENKYQLPSGACTSVPPSMWAWQCEPGIGSEASCVGIPEPRAFQAPASGIMPAPPAPPPQVVREGLIYESTERYTPWSGCHPQAMTLDEWARTVLPCGADDIHAAAAAPAGAGPFGTVGCLILGLAIAGAVADVFGRHR